MLISHGAVGLVVAVVLVTGALTFQWRTRRAVQMNEHLPDREIMS